MFFTVLTKNNLSNLGFANLTMSRTIKFSMKLTITLCLMLSAVSFLSAQTNNPTTGVNTDDNNSKKFNQKEFV